ncbi:MAG: oligosaccharide flippase family protein [Gordonia sp. (in: high G+C Gram-positive bacteria)]
MTPQSVRARATRSAGRGENAPEWKGQIRGLISYGLAPTLGIASGPILARFLGPEGRGQYAAIMAPVSVAGAIASLGVPSAVVYMAARTGSPKRCYRFGMIVALVPTLLTYGVMLLYATRVSDKQHVPYIALALAWTAVIFSAAVQIRRSYWQAQSAWRLLDIERGLVATARFIGVCAVAVLLTSSGVAVAAAALTGFVLASSVLYISAGPQDATPQLTGPERRQFVRYGLFASAGTITTIAGARLDQVLMPGTSTTADLGYYAVAVTVAEIPLVLCTLCSRNALQLASKGATLRRIFSSTAVYIVGMVASVVLICAASPFIIPLAFGSEFRQSVVPVCILSVGTVITSLSLIISTIVTGWGKPGWGSMIPVVSVLATVVLFWCKWGHITTMSASYISIISSCTSFVAAGCIIVFVGHRRAPGRWWR